MKFHRDFEHCSNADFHRLLDAVGGYILPRTLTFMRQIAAVL